MSKGINPAGREHNKCDILRLLRSAIHLCKLIGNIPQQTEKRDVMKTWMLHLRRGNSVPSANASDKRRPLSLICTGFLSQCLFAVSRKWPNPDLPAPQSLLGSSFTLTWGKKVEVLLCLKRQTGTGIFRRAERIMASHTQKRKRTFILCMS